MQHTCEKCGEPKDECEFYTFKRKKVCKKCNNKIHYKNHQEYYVSKGEKRRADPSKKEQLRKYGNRWMHNERQNNIQYKIKGALRARMYQALKGLAKSKGTEKLLGCTWGEFIVHIESLFKPGMTWQNYGKGPDKWNLDHVIPLASFDLSIPENQAKVSHFKNLQPLWQTENLKKSDTVLDTGSKI